MSLIQYSIKNMIGGVSQQPPSIRMQNQCEDMVNCIPSVTDFLKRRSGTSHIAKLLSSLPDNAFIDFIIRGEQEAGLLVITGGKATVYKLDGTQRGEVISAYLNCDSPRTDLKLMTINDYNFILNTTKTVATETTTGASQIGGFIFIKQAAYDTTYRIIANGRAYVYETPKDSSGGWRPSTENVANVLVGKIVDGKHTLRSIPKRCHTYPNHYQHFRDDAPLPDFSICGYPLEGGGTCSEPASADSPLYLMETTTPKPDGSIVTKFRHREYIIRFMTSLDVEISDSVSGQYMKLFKDKTSSFAELPVFAPNGYIMEITGDDNTKSDNYYVKFITHDDKDFGDGYWKETSKNGDVLSFNADTMPHILIVGNNSITFKQSEWKPRLIGDDDSCPVPTFAGKRINDIFFYRNRLCFLTDDNLIMSESGEYFNFFKTTATALLDSDPIDVAISSTSVSRLKYGVPYNEGLFLYSDGGLFVAEHGDILSTTTISVRPLLRFDSFLSSKPLVIDTNILYATVRGEHTQLREYIPNNSGDIYGYSNDITSHVPNYIPNDVRSVSACIEESLLFVTAGDGNIYVYKWQSGNNGERVQSAWGRWEFGGSVLSSRVINGAMWLIVKYGDGIYLEKLIIGERNGLLKDRRGLSATDYVSRYIYSRQFPRQDASSPTITAGRMQLRTIAIIYAAGSKFRLIIDRAGYDKEIREATGADESRFAVLSNSESTELTIESTGAEQFKLIETRVEALFKTRTRIV